MRSFIHFRLIFHNACIPFCLLLGSASRCSLKGIVKTALREKTHSYVICESVLGVARSIKAPLLLMFGEFRV